MNMHCEVKLIKKGYKLINHSGVDAFERFKARLKEDQVVEAHFETLDDTGTYLQLKKAHKLLRIMSEESGYTVEEMKMIVKHHCGLAYEKEINGVNYVIPLKSMGDMSMEELSKFIECTLFYADTKMNMVLE
jgi:hypothetical protein